MAVKLTSEKVMVKDNTDRVKSAESTLVQQANQIALKVSEESFNALAGRVTSAEASLTVQANEIAAKVSQSNFNALSERVSTAESTITQQADQITSKVSVADFNGNTIASKINQTATTIKLQASKITLEGIITANSNFKVLADGSIEAKNAKLSGAITATRMVSPSGAAYFGEIGVSGGKAGMGLYDTNYNSKAYFKVEELKEETGFNGFNIYDELGQLRISIRRLTTRIFGPTGETWIWLSPNSVTINSPNKQETW